MYNDRLLIGGYDGHGSSTTLAVARTLKIPRERVLLKYPDCNPKNLPLLLHTIMPTRNIIDIFDIAIDVNNPNTWIKSISETAKNNEIRLWDHHSTNIKELHKLHDGIKINQFSSASEMALGIIKEYEVELEKKLLILGAIADRDHKIDLLIDTESPEFQKLYTLSNIYDVLIRTDFYTTINGVYRDGIEYIEKVSENIEYPPESLAEKVPIKVYGDIVYAKLEAVNMNGWLWKTIDEILRRTGSDYLVGISHVLDKEHGFGKPIVIVSKSWLSKAPPPKEIVIDELGERISIGHDTAFGFSCRKYKECKIIAKKIIKLLGGIIR